VTTHNLAADAELAADLVRSAGRLAAQIREGGLDVTTKSHIGDILTQADLAAERLISERLLRERPDDGLLGEEGSSRAGARTWVVDPIDGTYNFAHGHTQWCSAIALVGENGEPILGAIYHPATDRLFMAGPSLPSTVTSGSTNAVPLSIVDKPLNRAGLVFDWPRDGFRGAAGEAHRDVIEAAASVRTTGSSCLELTEVASGRMDVLIKRDMHPWDRLPGQVIVLGAGGAADTFEAMGFTWSIIGAPTAVDEAKRILTSRC
jgi:myo-inositol-1(or 4)-monophosphatase